MCAHVRTAMHRRAAQTGRGTATTRNQVRTSDGRRGLHRHA